MSFVLGAIFGFLAVLAGAFGAHGLQGFVSDYGLHVWQTGSSYGIYHALALLALGLWERQAQKQLPLVRWCFAGGIIVFSGSLYLLALTGVKMLGMITPLGGLAFLVGWAALAWAARPNAV